MSSPGERGLTPYTPPSQEATVKQPLDGGIVPKRLIPPPPSDTYVRIPQIPPEPPRTNPALVPDEQNLQPSPESGIQEPPGPPRPPTPPLSPEAQPPPESSFISPASAAVLASRGAFTIVTDSDAGLLFPNRLAEIVNEAETQGLAPQVLTVDTANVAELCVIGPGGDRTPVGEALDQRPGTVIVATTLHGAHWESGAMQHELTTAADVVLAPLIPYSMIHNTVVRTAEGGTLAPPTDPESSHLEYSPGDWLVSDPPDTFGERTVTFPLVFSGQDLDRYTQVLSGIQDSSVGAVRFDLDYREFRPTEEEEPRQPPHSAVERADARLRALPPLSRELAAVLAVAPDVHLSTAHRLLQAVPGATEADLAQVYYSGLLAREEGSDIVFYHSEVRSLLRQTLLPDRQTDVLSLLQQDLIHRFPDQAEQIRALGAGRIISPLTVDTIMFAQSAAEVTGAEALAAAIAAYQQLNPPPEISTAPGEHLFVTVEQLLAMDPRTFQGLPDLSRRLHGFQDILSHCAIVALQRPEVTNTIQDTQRGGRTYPTRGIYWTDGPEQYELELLYETYDSLDEIGQPNVVRIRRNNANGDSTTLELILAQLPGDVEAGTYTGVTITGESKTHFTSAMHDGSTDTHGYEGERKLSNGELSQHIAGTVHGIIHLFRNLLDEPPAPPIERGIPVDLKQFGDYDPPPEEIPRVVEAHHTLVDNILTSHPDVVDSDHLEGDEVTKVTVEIPTPAGRTIVAASRLTNSSGEVDEVVTVFPPTDPLRGLISPADPLYALFDPDNTVCYQYVRDPIPKTGTAQILRVAVDGSMLANLPPRGSIAEQLRQQLIDDAVMRQGHYHGDQIGLDQLVYLTTAVEGARILRKDFVDLTAIHNHRLDGLEPDDEQAAVGGREFTEYIERFLTKQGYSTENPGPPIRIQVREGEHTMLVDVGLRKDHTPFVTIIYEGPMGEPRARQDHVIIKTDYGIDNGRLMSNQFVAEPRQEPRETQVLEDIDTARMLRNFVHDPVINLPS